MTERPVEGLRTPSGETVLYWTAGDLAVARHVVISPIPFSTRVSDASMQVRLAAQQAVLGDEFAVVGVQDYEPGSQEYSRQQNRTIYKGDFSPMADRILAVVDGVVSDEQLLHVYGYSRGADVGTQLVYNMVHDVNRGIAEVKTLGVVDAARTAERNVLQVFSDFGKSGNDLWTNVLQSTSSTLLEARGIDVHDERAEKEHQRAIERSVIRYFMSDLVGVVQYGRGTGTVLTLTQLAELSDRADSPSICIGRTQDSTVFPEGAFNKIKEDQIVNKFLIPGDHSVADRLQMSGALIVRSTLLA